ncbi:hypothetical protein AX17_006884 [Amanita inopinata Kibby_2008]|nr:hypothetical protein AX17_006884 [Amanita inopinata Kibby_2008]
MDSFGDVAVSFVLQSSDTLKRVVLENFTVPEIQMILRCLPEITHLGIDGAEDALPLLSSRLIAPRLQSLLIKYWSPIHDRRLELTALVASRTGCMTLEADTMPVENLRQVTIIEKWSTSDFKEVAKLCKERDVCFLVHGMEDVARSEHEWCKGGRDCMFSTCDPKFVMV